MLEVQVGYISFEIIERDITGSLVSARKEQSAMIAFAAVLEGKSGKLFSC